MKCIYISYIHIQIAILPSLSTATLATLSSSIVYVCSFTYLVQWSVNVHRVQNTTVSSSFHFDYSCHGNSQQENGTACFYFPLKSLSLSSLLWDSCFLFQEKVLQGIRVLPMLKTRAGSKKKRATLLLHFFYLFADMFTYTTK